MPRPPADSNGDDRRRLRVLLPAHAVVDPKLRVDRCHPGEHLIHREEVGDLFDVVDPEDVSTGPNAVRDCGQGSGEALSRRPAGDRADEILARHGQQQRPPERPQRPERAEHFDRLERGLRKIGPRIEHHLLDRDASPDRDFDLLAQELLDIRCGSTVEPWVEQLLLRGGARVHEHKRRARLGADFSKRRIAQAADIVDDRRPGRDRGARHLRLIGVDRHRRAEIAAHPLDHRHDPRDLLLELDRRPVRDS